MTTDNREELYFCYYDESGDDGHPKSSSKFFILTAIYFPVLRWASLHQEIVTFRRGLLKETGFPIRAEMHTRAFLLGKTKAGKAMSGADRVQIVDRFCNLIGRLNFRIINVVIVKPRIRKDDYKVLDTALNYSIQRVSNDMEERNGKAIIITDPGRVGRMRRIIRKAQIFHFINSKFGGSYRREIDCLIEDALTKDSTASSFIQMCDVVTYVMNLYSIGLTGFGRYPKRLPKEITPDVVYGWMKLLEPAFNPKACPAEPFSIMFHPKQARGQSR